MAVPGPVGVSRLRGMTPFVALLVGLFVGLAAGALVTWLVLRRVATGASRNVLVSDHVERVIGSLQAAVAVVDRDDAVVVASPFARGSGLVRGSTIASAEVRKLLGRARSAGAPLEAEVTVTRTPGSPAVLLGVQARPLPDGSAVITGEDRSAAQRFAETRRDFVANVTHELKTPIGAITLLAEAADAAADDPEAVRHFLAKLTRESARLNELVSQIIALSRLQAEAPQWGTTAVDVATVLESAVSRCRALADAAGISVNLSVRPGVTVTGDADELETAVTNLVQNAVAYSEPGARVAVSSRVNGDRAEIRVSDNGIGISEADQARIFERFYRVDADRSRASGGTGLGLSIVKHVAQAHGGEVSLWSRHGQGSTFTLSLPVDQGGETA